MCFICLYSGTVIGLEKISVGTQKDENSIDFYLLSTHMFMHSNFDILLDTLLYKRLLSSWINLTGVLYGIYFRERQCEEIRR